MPRGFGAQIYATQSEGGIKGDGRVGITFQNGDYTVSELNKIVDGLQELIKNMNGTRLQPQRRVDVTFE